MVKHGQVDGNVFELVYNEPFPSNTLTRSMQMVLLELMAYDNQREIDAQRKADNKSQATRKDARYEINTMTYEEVKFRSKYPDLVFLPVTILTTKEWENLGQPTDHDRDILRKD